MIIQGDCLEKLKELPDESVDAIVTDPPYELGFMGKGWDSTGVANNKDMWKECLRVLKPGGHLLSFGGTRTYHRMASAIEDAGFEIRDMIEWVYGSGFPKSLNIGKAVDKIQGNEREAVGRNPNSRENCDKTNTLYESGTVGKTDILTKGTSEWEGWGTALKPSHEPICMARKPLAEKTVAENVLKYGTGGINIDESRVEYTSEKDKKEGQSSRPNSTSKGMEFYAEGEDNDFNRSDRSAITGRFPANLIHDGSDEVRECFPETKSGGTPKIRSNRFNAVPYNMGGGQTDENIFGNSGNASRFFKSIIYQAKASKAERNRGCEGLEEKEEVYPGINTFDENGNRLRADGSVIPPLKSKNNHPTVKPIALMEYLINMVTKEGQTVLDPFTGSGTTLIAAKKLGRNYIGIELEPEYVKIAEARIKSVQERLV